MHFDFLSLLLSFCFCLWHASIRLHLYGGLPSRNMQQQCFVVIIHFWRCAHTTSSVWKKNSGARNTYLNWFTKKYYEFYFHLKIASWWQIRSSWWHAIYRYFLLLKYIRKWCHYFIQTEEVYSFANSKIDVNLILNWNAADIFERAPSLKCM